MATDVSTACRGLLAFLAKQGGSLPMRELDTHQAFPDLVAFDAGTPALTAADGRALADG